MLVDLRPKNLTGKEAEAIPGAAHMTCNKNGIPNDPQKPMVTSGIRLGTPAMTTRGFGGGSSPDGQPHCRRAGQPHDEANIAAVRAKVTALTARLPGLPLSTTEAPHALPFAVMRETQVARRGTRRGRRRPSAPSLSSPRQALHHL